MKLTHVARAAGLSLLAAGLLRAAPAAAAEGKIAYVDLNRAINETDEGQAAKSRLQAQFQDKQKMLDERKTDFEKLRADFEKQSSVMSEDARKKKQAELEAKAQELQKFFMEQQKELSEKEREAVNGIREKMVGVIRQIADADGISLVLQGEALVYGSNALDLTNESIRKYNARYKAAGAPAASSKKGTGKKESK